MQLVVRKLALWAPVLALLVCLVHPAWAAPTFPQLTGRVVDAANVIPPEVEARIDQRLAGLEAQSGRQLVVATLADLQGYEIADYGYQLGRAWGIGSKEENDGALLIVAPKERKLRIEVGYGLEGVLTDGMSSLIINQTIVPRFKEGDMAGGIEAGVEAIAQLLALPEEEAQRLAQEANARAAAGDGFDWGGMIFLGMILVFFVLPAFFRRGRGRRYRSGGFAPIIWGMGAGRSWGGGGWSGGGGFSGGGGSFGGGGSSGSW